MSNQISDLGALNEALERIEMLERKLKNYEPVSHYNGYGIEYWYRECIKKTNRIEDDCETINRVMARNGKLEAALRRLTINTSGVTIHTDMCDTNFYGNGRTPHCDCGAPEARALIEATPAGTSVEPIQDGQHCHLCNAVHDLMSACPPKETKGDANG